MIKQTDVEKLAKKWISALRLEDWKLSIGLVEGKDLEDDGQLGSCRPDPRFREAEILLAKDRIETKAELEEVLVHELNHVVLSTFSSVCVKDEMGMIHLEEVVVKLTGAMIKS